MFWTPGDGIVNDGLVLYLDAGIKGSYPGSDTTWTDLSGSNNGTLTNGPTYSSANGGSIVFDGVDDYVITTTLGDFGSQLDTSGLTMEIALKTTDTSKINQLLGTLNLGVGMGLVIDLNRSSNMAYTSGFTDFYLREDGNNVVATHITTNIYTGDWFVLVGTWAPGSSNYDIYVNGVTQTTVNGQIGTVTASSNFQYPLILGAVNSRGAAVSYSPTTIGFFRLYNRALSASEVTQNFEATRGRFGI